MISQPSAFLRLAAAPPPFGVCCNFAVAEEVGSLLRSTDRVLLMLPRAVRVFLPKCWFDETKCARGIDALKLYRAEYDDRLQALRPPLPQQPCRTAIAAGDPRRPVR